MSQLLIIDVQNSYRKAIGKTLYKKIEDFSQGFNQLIYLWDNVSGEVLFNEVPEDWTVNEKDPESAPFFDSFDVLKKQYGFFRDLMDFVTNHKFS